MTPSPTESLSLPFEHLYAGKVREIYRLPQAESAVPGVALIASDRISAFDVIMPTPIPLKGELLTRIAMHWFAFIESRDLASTHLLARNTSETATMLIDLGLDPTTANAIAPRTTLGRSCEVVPVECVVRGYLDGSGWKEYLQSSAVCGVPLPSGLQRGSKLPDPIFTPATKAQFGEHDENISFDQACNLVGEDVMRTLRENSINIYTQAHEHAASRGVILADTKFEFGFPLDHEGERVGDEPIIVDEALTPDSSRYWPAETWSPGGAQSSFDKQFLRDYLESLTANGDWDKQDPGPELPADVVSGTFERYERALQLLFDSIS